MSRYHRQELLPGIGSEGQQRLRESTVAVVGCGALGSNIADLLARAGVGRLRIIDRDLVELTNLQRQTLYAEADVGKPKALAAATRLQAINSTIAIEPLAVDMNASNIRRHLEECDVIVDGLDNFQTRYLLNDYAVANHVPYVYGGAVATEGMSFAVLPPSTTEQESPWGTPTACLRCLFPEPPTAGTIPTCDTAGVIAPVVMMIAAHEVMQTIKILVGRHDDVDRSLMSIDVWNNETRRLAPPPPRQDCPCCGKRDFPWLKGQEGVSSTMLCGRDAVQILPPRNDFNLSLAALCDRLQQHGSFVHEDGIVRGTLQEEQSSSGESIQLTVFEDMRALISHIESPERARAIYDRYVGS
ncbi:MAG: thiamine biosynthesis protein ThiF [Phycisphaerae bacterium]|nr:thiamine biosynthesis protein ThiF [Phycisphaerae bacterium]|tara:strand:+ start:206 stop:1276 length:1071 start_codon:yes stop_codon:yes gene_type:complete